MLLSGGAPAFAQQTTSNVVTQAEDAFGRAVGNDRIGIYSNDEVRGFNPTEAGNQRIEGLYIEQGAVVPPRLIESLSVRVGYGARGLTFPAPTGIVDYRLEKFSGKARYSAELEWETNANVVGALEAKIPLSGDRLGVALGVGFRESDQVHGRNGSYRNYIAGVSFLPTKGSEFILFTGGATARKFEYDAILYPAGSFVPPRQPRTLQQSQPWTRAGFDTSTTGGIAKFSLGDLRVETGLFRVTRRDLDTFYTLQLGVSPTGTIANSLVIADANTKTLSTSGEFRVSRVWTGKTLRHSVIASLRGRDQHRNFGGQQLIPFGPAQAGAPVIRPRPVLNFGLDDTSRIRQMSYGLQYNLLALNGSTLGVAVQRSNYRKRTDFGNAALVDTVSRDNPWLYSANGSLLLLPGLSVYGGYIRGLEESAVAPDIATNRSEAPPALRTRQMDAGIRYALTPKLAVIAGVFDIKKPYFGVDAASRFTNLGTVANRGIELSIAGALADGLTLVAGGILVNPKISGAEVDAGRIGKQPVGTFRKRGIFNLDWKPAGQQAWSFDLSLDGQSGENADRLNRFSAPSRSNVNFGTRYRFTIGKTKVLVRGQLQNAFNNYGWRVNSGGGFTFTQPRSAYVHLIADF